MGHTQVSDAKTAVAIVPSDPAHTTGKRRYWILSAGAKSFTITPKDLEGFGRGESIDIYVGSATNTNYADNGNNIDIISLNATTLPNVKLKL